VIETKLSFEKHIVIEVAGQTAISALSENCPQISKQKLKQAMQFGAVWLTPKFKNNQSDKTSRCRRAKKNLSPADELHLYFDEKILFSDIPPATLIADEGDYSVWNKPCGMFSQGTKWGDHSSIARWVELFGLEKNNLEKRPTFLVHRLDRATSGLIIIAHSKNACRRLAYLFEARKVNKQYTAKVQGCFPRTSWLLDQDIDGKNAITQILSSTYDSVTNHSRLRIKIKTGRKHQIRKHLSATGYSVQGDRLYGNVNREVVADLMLKSCLLEFECPIANELKSYTLPS